MKYECDPIRDLMPLCADGAASDASKKAVRTHTEACTECAKVWADYQMGLDLKADASAPQEDLDTEDASVLQEGIEVVSDSAE